MKFKHGKDPARRILQAHQTKHSIFDLEALVVAVGGDVREGEGSRVVFEINGKRLYPHRPHPGKEAKRELLETQGITP